MSTSSLQKSGNYFTPVRWICLKLFPQKDVYWYLKKAQLFLRKMWWCEAVDHKMYLLVSMTILHFFEIYKMLMFLENHSSHSQLSNWAILKLLYFLCVCVCWQINSMTWINAMPVSTLIRSLNKLHACVYIGIHQNKLPINQSVREYIYMKIKAAMGQDNWSKECRVIIKHSKSSSFYK